MSLNEYDKTWQIVEKPASVATRSKKSGSEPAGSNPASPTVPKITVDTTGIARSQNLSPLDVPGPSSNPTSPTSDTEIGYGSNADEDEEPVKTILKVMDVTEMETATGHTILTKSRRVRKRKAKKDRFQDYAAIMRRKLNEKGMTISIELEIKSPILRKKFKEIFKDFERLNLDADPIIIPKPYEPLFYKREEIRRAREEATSPQLESELDVILEFMDLNLDETLSEYNRNVYHKKITADITWTLFPPGELIVFNADSSAPAQCLIVKDCMRQFNKLQLTCTLYQYNGRNFGTTKRKITFDLPPKPGSFPITDLALFPLKYHRDYRVLEKALIGRGRKYAKIVKRSHMNYNGIIWAEDAIDGDLIQIHVNSRVMVDHALYVRQCPPAAQQARLDEDPGVDIDESTGDICYCGNPNCTIGRPTQKDAKDTKSVGKQKEVEPHEITLSDQQAICCPGKVKGFALTDKIWAEFRVDKLTEIDWNQKAYDRLELDEEYKQVIKGLVSSHRKHAGGTMFEFDDVIAGKGLGLVFLLQGPPGLGKTLTAESVAEQAKKPLYTVTSGELGTTVSDMESALAKAFRIAKEWNAILLLDEADVFLSKRSADNLEKNAFVSVFLRLMEYYQGILFLTTNRAEDFDQAFLSRIHLILDYPQLTAQRRANIWRNLSENMNKQDSLGEEGIQRLGRELEINGREIKNLLRTSWALAKENGQALGLEDILTVAKLSVNYGGKTMSTV